MRTRELPSGWLRTDAVLAAAMGLLGCFLAWLAHLVQRGIFDTPVWLHALGSLLLAVPLVWRRRYPLSSGIVVAIVYGIVISTMGLDLYTSQVVLFMSFYSIGAWSLQRQRADLTRILISAGMGLWLIVAFIVRTVRQLEGTATALPVGVLLAGFTLQVSLNIAFFTGAWIFGNRAWTQAVEREELERANAAIQDLKQELVDSAIEQERLRIARELHDVVAHHITTMSVQAAAARRLIMRDPETAATALKHIETSARHAVGELRTMVTTLRSNDGDTSAPPTATDLPELIEAARNSGLDVAFEILGDVPEVTPAVGLTLYRVAQEGLTNAAKHAGPSAHVEVRLRGRPDLVELEVSDDGRGTHTDAPGTGTGLIGMRERVEAVGGTLTTGAKNRGGFRVRAEIPTGVPA